MRLRSSILILAILITLGIHSQSWTTRVSRPNKIQHGLDGKHISLWASHGRYYDIEKGRWKWQRPMLFGATEDLFTQTIVVPYLIPMLENAGAVVFTPRERDWQKNEIIVDNDYSKLPNYMEVNIRDQWEQAPYAGFSMHNGTYDDGENPFISGTARQIKATRKRFASEISYQPSIPEDGKYAVYVSYQSLPNSVPDAQYIVWHQGQKTEFRVNQQMGGNTWVYLGTFQFDQGCSTKNRVIITGNSSHKGIVTTDAIRFGGGMGNIQRGDSTSGYPRALEGARYYAQWAGAPYDVYSSKNGMDDYGDDINVRSLMTNWLGNTVPFDLTLAIHSDAGFDPEGKELVGSLAIYTTDFNNGLLKSGESREKSHILAESLLENLTHDIQVKYGKWNRRYLWDRNYSETRLPDFPSAILETMSHQSFPDMIWGQDPNFRFTVARSIYKTILRNITESPIIAPLAPTRFMIRLNDNGKATLSWADTYDPYEQSASATSYNIYTATEDKGFDNGINIDEQTYSLKLEPNKLYQFKVTACNEGGESFPSETLTVLYRPHSRKKILIVNGFHRLSAPAVINNDSLQGFDLDKDPGVSYGLTAGWGGYQTCFNKQGMGIEGPGGMGYGGNELAGHFIAGNDFNYTVTHAEAIAANPEYSITSCAVDAVLQNKVNLKDYDCVDLILGLEKYEPYTLNYYKTFTSKLQEHIRQYTQQGGSLIVSGSYIGSDMKQPGEKKFLQDILKLQYIPTDKNTLTHQIHGLGMLFDIYKELSHRHYAATAPEVLMPTGNAICAMQYSDGSSAAVGYQGKDYHVFTMGFPFECIVSRLQREQIMMGILNYIDQ